VRSGENGEDTLDDTPFVDVKGLKEKYSLSYELGAWQKIGAKKSKP